MKRHLKKIFLSKDNLITSERVASTDSCLPFRDEHIFTGRFKKKNRFSPLRFHAVLMCADRHYKKITIILEFLKCRSFFVCRSPSFCGQRLAAPKSVSGKSMPFFQTTSICGT